MLVKVHWASALKDTPTKRMPSKGPAAKGPTMKGLTTKGPARKGLVLLPENLRTCFEPSV